jgi:prolyl-tRNA synthetase
VIASRLAGVKETIALDDVAGSLPARLDAYHEQLLTRASRFLASRRARVDTWDEFKARVADGWADALHCGRPECGDLIKAETGATPRCIPNDAPPESGRCIRCDAPSAWGRRVLFAKAY